MEASLYCILVLADPFVNPIFYILTVCVNKIGSQLKRERENYKYTRYVCAPMMILYMYLLPYLLCKNFHLCVIHYV